MNYLFIDTTKTNALIYVFNGKDEKSIVLDDTMKHSEHLLTEIENALINLNLELKDIDVMGVCNGPGSFTGIRIGVATIKSFATVFGACKLVSFNIFEAFKNIIKNGNLIINCTKKSSYVAKIKNCEIQNYNVIENSEINSLKDDSYIIDLEQNLYNESYKNLKVIKNYYEALINYFKECVKNNSFLELSKIEPFYVQPSQAEMELSKKENK